MRPFVQLLSFVLASGFLSPAYADPSRSPPASGGAQIPLGQSLEAFLDETPVERNALESITIDKEEEERIGDEQLGAFLGMLDEQDIRVVRKGRNVEYVSRLVKLIQPRMRHAGRYRKIRVYVANTPDTDARAFPGGSVVVMSGLIEFAESEATLVGILGHELSHIDHGHQLRMARAFVIAQNTWEPGSLAPQHMQQQIMLMAKNFARPFRPEDEAIADRDAVTWAFGLGYEPLEFAKLFERYGKRYGQKQAKDRANIPSFLLTHPSYANRLESIRKAAAKLRDQSRDASSYVGRLNLEHRVPREIREFPE